MWQELHEELQGHGFTVVSVAFDSQEGVSRQWLDEARTTHVALIDRYHHVAELYNMVNVNQAVWIDEAGRIVRPTESAGVYEAFRKADRETLVAPPDEMKIGAEVRRIYHDALRDWVRRGEASPHAFDAAQARDRLVLPNPDTATAHAAFRLGQHLIRSGRTEEGYRHQAEASRLHPDSWNIWRQGAKKNEKGFAATADFWDRVDALGDKRYYAPVDMAGMPR